MDLFFEEENCGRPETPSRMFFEFDGKRNIKIVVLYVSAKPSPAHVSN